MTNNPRNEQNSKYRTFPNAKLTLLKISLSAKRMINNQFLFNKIGFVTTEHYRVFLLIFLTGSRRQSASENKYILLMGPKIKLQT